MTAAIRALFEQAKRLTAEERAELAGALLDTVDDGDDGTPEEIEAAWADEIQRRDELVLADDGGAHDVDDVLVEAEQLLRANPAR